MRNRVFFALALLIGLWPYLWLACDLNDIYVFRDIGTSYLPTKKFWLESVTSFGTVPRWNPHTFGGMPYWADQNLSPLLPTNLAMLLFPVAKAYEAFLLFSALHVALLFVSVFVFLRSLRVSSPGASLGACALCVGGVSVSLSSLMNVQASLPAVFFFFALLRQRREIFFPLPTQVLLALALAWPIYAGDPQISYSLVLYFICERLYATTKCRNPWALAPLFTVGALSFGFSAAQLLPTFGLLRETARGQTPITLDVAERFSFHPARALELFLPHPWGGTKHYWGTMFTETIAALPFLPYLYSGVVLVFAFCVGVLRKRNRALLVGIFALFALCFGKYGLVDAYKIFYHVVPGWHLFRYPERLLVFLPVLLIAVSAPWLRWLFTARVGFVIGNLKTIWIFLGTVAATIAVFGACYYTPDPYITVPLAFAHFGLMAALLLLVIFYRRLPTPLVFLFLAGLIFFDSFFPGTQFFLRLPRHHADEGANVVAKKIKDNIEARGEALRMGGAFRYFHGTNTGAPLSAEADGPVLRGMASDWENLWPNMHQYFGVSAVAGDSPFTPAAYAELWARFKGADPKRVLDLFSAYYLASPGESGRTSVSANPGALPYVWVPDRVREAGTADLSARFLSYPYRTTALIEADAERASEWANSSARISQVERAPDIVTMRVEAAGDAMLVINHSFHRSWRAFWNGKELPLRKANLWALGVMVPKGEGKLELRYEDSLIRIGTWITVLFALAGAVLFYRQGFRRKF